MQDNYVGDIGDYGKYGLLRAIALQNLSLQLTGIRFGPKSFLKKA